MAESNYSICSPRTVGITIRGKSYPEKPALTNPVPLSITKYSS
jgi:hypothetical protein